MIMGRRYFKTAFGNIRLH